MFEPHENPKFAAVAAVLLVLVLALAGFMLTGWSKGTNEPVTASPSSSVTASASATPTATPTPTATVDPFADWKTFTNASKAYSIKHDSDWTLGKESTASEESAPNRVSWTEFSNSAFGKATFNVEIQTTTDSNATAWAYAEQHNDAGESYTETGSTVDDISAITLTNERAVRTGVVKGSKLFIFHLIFNLNETKSTQLTKIYTDMLSTADLK